MNGLVKKVIVYSLIGCLQLGVGATAAEAAARHDDNRHRQEQRVSKRHAEDQRRMHERERRQHEEQQRMHEEREREWRHHEAESRHHHYEDGHDDDNTVRDIGLGLILLAILANSSNDSEE